MSTEPPTTWEYATTRPPREATMEEASDPESVLNQYGADGWELVETIEYTGGGTKYLVFKRPAGVETSGRESR